MLEHAGRVRAGAFDYDGTLTSGSQWRALGSLMSQRLQDEDAANREWYWSQNLEEDDSLGMDDPDWFHGSLDPGNQTVAEGAWIAETIHLYRQAGITREQVRQVASTLPPREGALQLLGLFDPRVVISFGVEQLIQDWLHHQDMNSTPVAASRLKFNGSDVISGCHINLVVSGTKRVAAAKFRKKTGVREDELMVLGDSIVDAEMMVPGGFNVLIIPPGEADKKLAGFRNGNLVQMWDRLTAILFSDSLLPLVDLIKMSRADT